MISIRTLLCPILITSLVLTAGCSNDNDDDDNDAPANLNPPTNPAVLPSTNEDTDAPPDVDDPMDQPDIDQPPAQDDPATGRIPYINISFPLGTEITTTDVSANSFNVQEFVTAIIRDDSGQFVRIACVGTLEFVTIGEEDTFNAYIDNSTPAASIISIEDRVQDGRNGREVTYAITSSNGLPITGIASFYFFNAEADQLDNNATILLDCGALTENFSVDEAIIDGIMDSVRFNLDTTAGRSDPFSVTSVASDDRAIEADSILISSSAGAFEQLFNNH